MLLNAYKALFCLMMKDFDSARQCYEKAISCRSSVGSDAAQLTPQLLKPASQQHQSLLLHIRAMIENVKGNDYKVVQTLFCGEKDLKGDDKSAKTTQGHQSCYSTPKQDEVSKADLMYQKCKQLHPQFYFNNLGILHLKLRKYKMAAFSFSKALKFLEVAQNVTIQAQGASGAPNQFQIIGEGFQQSFAAQ